MHGAGGGEKYISWSKRLPALTADEFARSSSNKIDLIARVWLLWIDTTRRVNLDEQTAMLENSREALSFGSGQAFERLSHSCSDTGIV